MPWLLVVLSLLCVALSELGAVLPAHASSVTRRPRETPESFAKRNGPPRTTLVHHVIETRAWGGASPAIIAFYEEPFEESGQEYRRIAGYVFVPDTPSRYRKVLIGTFDPEGGDPNIETVFFARVGRDPLPKLFIIVSWPQVHYDVRGTFYATFVYAAPRPGVRATRLKWDEALSKKLEGGCECEWRDGAKRVATFKTADDVKAALRTMAP